MINKKTLFVTAVLILFSIAPHVLAQGFVPLAPIEGLTKGVAANTEGLAIFFNNLYKFAIGMATVLAVIMIIWGGIEYSWQDIPGAKSNGKERIQQAILGLVLVLSPVLVFSIINPAILNLSINLKPLDTKSGSSTGSGGGSGTQTSITTNGVTQSVKGTYLKTATFSSGDLNKATQAATSWVAQCGNSVWGGVLANSAAGPAVGSCPGGYDSSGVCVGGTRAATIKAMCVYASQSPFIFVDVSTGWFGTGFSLLHDYSLKPTGSDGSSFVSQCVADGGLACVSKSSGITSISPCPSRSFTIPQNAHNASSGGDCYQATLICVPSATAATIDRSSSIGLCKAGASLTN